MRHGGDGGGGTVGDGGIRKIGDTIWVLMGASAARSSSPKLGPRNDALTIKLAELRDSYSKERGSAVGVVAHDGRESGSLFGNGFRINLLKGHFRDSGPAG